MCISLGCFLYSCTILVSYWNKTIKPHASVKNRVDFIGEHVAETSSKKKQYTYESTWGGEFLGACCKSLVER